MQPGEPAAPRARAREGRGSGRVRAGDLTTVEQLEAHASACELCRLSRDRTMVVVGSGPHDAEVLVVSEAPGYHEDREGRLLAGRVGGLFDEVLAEAGLTRDEVFLTSVVKCRPPTGRTPFPDEVEACEGWLFRELALVEPAVVVTLGSLALRLVTGRQESLADAHGAVVHAQVRGRDIVVWPLYHPAAALHVPALVDELRTDARALRRLLGGARADARRVAPVTAPSIDPAHDASNVAMRDDAPAVSGFDADPDGPPQLAFELP
ncbi:MAG: Uracil-DNA glycosylase [Thermoleophilia bacterium]|nr:Uracil-DNA glycosylase [Thermoleophilia bacterium]